MDRTFGAPAQRRRNRRRPLILLLMMLAVGSLGAGAFSLALFTDTQSATGGFSTGTIVLGASPSALFSVSGMMPGDMKTATLSVENNGTGDLRYAMTSTSTDADGKNLAAQLSLDVKAGACPGAGASLYTGALGSAALGDPTTGAQAGDRTLLAGTSESLCFSVALPSTTGNAYQNSATTTTFTFAAEQTANN